MLDSEAVELVERIVRGAAREDRTMPPPNLPRQGKLVRLAKINGARNFTLAAEEYLRLRPWPKGHPDPWIYFTDNFGMYLEDAQTSLRARQAREAAREKQRQLEAERDRTSFFAVLKLQECELAYLPEQEREFVSWVRSKQAEPGFVPAPEHVDRSSQIQRRIETYGDVLTASVGSGSRPQNVLCRALEMGVTAAYRDAWPNTYEDVRLTAENCSTREEIDSASKCVMRLIKACLSWDGETPEPPQGDIW
jgi:hypothetical protein